MSFSLRSRRTLRPLVAAVALGLAALATPAATPPPALGVGPLPDCRIADVFTSPRDYDSWSTTLVDWTLRVGRGYKPPDLVPVGDAGLSGGGLVRKVAIDDLGALAKAAAANGTPIGSWSAYRSYRTQARLFNDGVKAWGYETATRAWGRPGHSEHQLGLAIDFSVAGGSGFISGDSATGRWMARNAWKYGWVLSYPDGKTDITCYHYEPWHFRYYGRDLAAKIHDSGLTTREYLWAKFTNASPSASPTAHTGGASTPPATGSSAPAPLESQSPGISEPPMATPPAPPASPAGVLLGLDPPAAIAGLLLILASIGLVVSLRLGRRRR